MVCQGSFNSVKRGFTEVSKKFQVCFKKVLRVFQEFFKGVEREIEGCFKNVFRGFQGYLKEVHRNFQRSFKGVLRIFKEVSGAFKESFIIASRKCQWCFKED